MESELNDEQRTIVEAPAPEIVVIAGPGSGKSTTMVARLSHVAAKGLESPARTAVVTFTVKAADEMRARIGGQADAYFHIGTFHSFCLKLLERGGNYRPGLIVLDTPTADKLLLAAAAAVKLKKPLKRLREMVGKPARPGSESAMLGKVYGRAMKDLNAIDFDTILLETLQSLPSMGEVGVDHIYVDEFQDTSEIDLAIYRALPVKTRFYVGDLDQAVFSFRGARPQNMMDAAGEIGVYNATLENNYRSEPQICEIGNRLILHNTGRATKTMKPQKKGKAVLELRAHPDAVAEANGIADRIKEFIADGVPLAEIAVLCRYNRHAAGLAAHLVAAGIPVRARVKINGADELDLAIQAANAIKSQNGIAWAMAKGEFQPHELMQATRIEARQLAGFQDHVEPMPTDLQGLYRSLRTMGVKERPARAFCALSSTQGGEFDLGRGVTAAREVSEQGRQEAGDGVRCLTIHAAKGLEFDHVFIPALENEIMPGNKKADAVQEERRLLFVAITRARTGLYLSYSGMRAGWQPGAIDRHSPSDFIGEMGLMPQSS